MLCEMPWDNNSIGDILKAAARLPQEPQSRQKGLDTYSGKNVPGQIWSCYKSKKNEKLDDVTLEKKLHDLLAPSTSWARLDELTTAQKQVSLLPAYLCLRQNKLNKEEWLVDADTGELHNGAHFPLFMTTRNSSHRSKQGQARRAEQWPIANQRWAKYGTGKTAVAAGASWWMTAESSGTPAWLEERKAEERDATIASLQQRASDAGQSMVELAVDKDVAAPNDEHRHWSGSHWDWKYDQSWSDWDWSWSQRDWKHDQSW